MRSIACALTVAIALLAVHASAAQPAMTAGDLEQLCAGSDHVSRNACRIYILGVTQGITLGFELAHSQSGRRRPCMPAGISAETLEETVKRRLAALGAPAERARDAAGFIGAVLAAAFPCTKPPVQAPR
jgi:Rap1a immunity proteins